MSFLLGCFTLGVVVVVVAVVRRPSRVVTTETQPIPRSHAHSGIYWSSGPRIAAPPSQRVTVPLYGQDHPTRRLSGVPAYWQYSPRVREDSRPVALLQERDKGDPDDGH